MPHKRNFVKKVERRSRATIISQSIYTHKYSTHRTAAHEMNNDYSSALIDSNRTIVHNDHVSRGRNILLLSRI
ncbi:hypothetical protein BJV82DRAFT_606525, partial [Fennellomyces sp. T-0311]